MYIKEYIQCLGAACVYSKNLVLCKLSLLIQAAVKDRIFLYIHLSKQHSVQFTSELLYMIYKISELTTYRLVG